MYKRRVSWHAVKFSVCDKKSKNYEEDILSCTRRLKKYRCWRGGSDDGAISESKNDTLPIHMRNVEVGTTALSLYR